MVCLCIQDEFEIHLKVKILLVFFIENIATVFHIGLLREFVTSLLESESIHAGVSIDVINFFSYQIYAMNIIYQ